MEKSFQQKVLAVQMSVKATKEQRNDFAKYNYRSAEQILAEVKPALSREGLTMTITDEVVAVGDRVYVKAVVRLTDGVERLEVSAFAREADDKKGMDASQVTGSTSSYARKYALCGMFLLDDNKDADTEQFQIVAALGEVNAATSEEELRVIWEKYPQLQSVKNFQASINNKKSKLKA